ncbi:uncharacterized protein LOC143462177 [Clavelina lepadiformis]|uniref:ribonuclease H n=1 Tax=Clavelina lepadiformis TaxID=159417 RepID=A0ABP0GM90_CLALP
MAEENGQQQPGQQNGILANLHRDGDAEVVARNMRTISCDMRSLKVFDLQGDPHSLSQRWRKWTRSFNLYVNGIGVTDDVQKRSLLLHTAGEEVQELYYSLVNEQNAIIQTFEETVNVLNEQFIPTANVPFERHVFHQLVQNSNETVDQYVCRLRQRAATCEFQNADERIRDQVVDKCYSRELQRKFLEQQTLTLVDVLRIAKAHEAVIARTIIMSSTPDSVQVNAVTGSRRNQMRSTNKEGKECFACGRKGDAQCPAKGKTCNKCGKVGHFGMKCRSRTIDQRSPEHGRARKPRRAGPRTHAVEEEEEIHRTFSIKSNRQNGFVTLSIGGVKMDMLVDSGSSCNLLSSDTREWLKKSKVKIIKKTPGSKKKLFGYDNDKPLPIRGTFEAVATSDASGKKCEAEFVVVSCDGTSLLGKKSAEELGLLHVGPFPQVVSNVDEDVVRQHKKLFTGIGLLKDYKLNLHIDESVRPVAQPVRRVPFQLRDKVEEKLDELLQADIIEAVPEGPTTWISPLVVIPKPDGDIRICVDMHRANEAIVRERHPIPTVEELLLELNGSTVFSKLDLKWGFHQIMLDEDSRHVTTFVTHQGLYRYKRLMFGLNSAPEKYQKIIRDVLKNCIGVANIADGVIVHGQNREEHDRRLSAVLDKLEEAGLTLKRSVNSGYRG